MHRCGSGFLLTLAITLVLALAGCLGKSTSNAGNGGVQSVTLSPGENISIDVGGTQVFSATGKDANGHPVLGVNIQFVVQSQTPNGSAPLSIASNGNACAGTWDASDAICSPGTSGIATVYAVIEGVSSTITTVYVHQHVDSIVIKNAENQSPQYDCFSQGQTWTFGAFAYSNIGGQNVDISNTLGPMSWSSSNAGVVTATPTFSGPLGNQVNQVQTTAATPGITQLFANVSGTTSSPYPYTTCLVKAVWLQIAGQGQAGNSITVNAGTSVSITATAVDTLYGIANNVPLAKAPLTWSTTNPEVVAFGTTTNTTGTNSAAARNNVGGATVFASCTPPSCNVGVLPSLPIYASNCLPTSNPPCQLPNGSSGYGTISVDVIPTSSGVPTYTAWAATTDCQNQPGCSSALFSLAPSLTNPIGTILSLPRTPNSMMFNHLSTSRLYLGSDQGLMYVDIGPNAKVSLVSNSTTPCSASLCGKVLTISNDGKLVVVSDTVSTPSQVYIYNGSATAGAAPVDLVIPGETATAAAFSPDQLKIFILTNAGNMYVYSTVDALTPVPVATSVTDVKFSADGSFAYVAGTPVTPANSISGFANCDTPATSVLNPVTTTATSLALFPSPTLQLDSPPTAAHTSPNWTEVVYALDPPYIDSFGVNVTQNPLPYNQFACTSPTVTLDPYFPKTSAYVGQGNFTPVYSQLVADGNELIVVARHIPAVLVFNVSNGTTSPIPLNGSNTDPLAAAASTDGSQVYVATCDQYQGTTCAVGTVHIVTSEGDVQDVPYANINEDNNPNMCNGQGVGAPLCLPNMIAIKPQ